MNESDQPEEPHQMHGLSAADEQNEPGMEEGSEVIQTAEAQEKENQLTEKLLDRLKKARIMVASAVATTGGSSAMGLAATTMDGPVWLRATAVASAAVLAGASVVHGWAASENYKEANAYAKELEQTGSNVEQEQK